MKYFIHVNRTLRFEDGGAFLSSLSGKILENGVMPCRGNVSHRKSTEANFLVRSNSVRNYTVTYLSCRTIIRLGLEGLAFYIRFGWVDLVFV